MEYVSACIANEDHTALTDITPEHVVIDANHTLAGKDLDFEVELIKLQKVVFMCTIASATLQAKTAAAASDGMLHLLQYCCGEHVVKSSYKIVQVIVTRSQLESAKAIRCCDPLYF